MTRIGTLARAATISAFFYALALAGCAQLQSGLKSAEDFVTSPETQETVATLKVVSTALVCDVSAGSALAKEIEGQVGAHQGVTSLIAVSSATVCTALQGTLTGATVANTDAVVSVATPASSVATPASSVAAAKLRKPAPRGRVLLRRQSLLVIQE